MATYTQLINAVLRRLRESEVAAPTTTTYATLIGDFVNQTKREVEDAWKWHSLRQTIAVTTAASTNGYSITGAGKRFRFIDQKRRAYDATNFGYVNPGAAQVLKKNLLTDTSTGLPMNYYIEGIDSSGDPKVYFYSLPDGVYTINFDLVVPQADLSAGTDVLTVDEWPVILGAYAKALAERGEDNGKTHGEALNQYGFALSDAIAMDAALGHDEDEWMVE
jgi:hypothetical protein